MITKQSVERAGKVLKEALDGDFQARGAVKQIVTDGGIGTSLSEAITTTDLAAAFTATVKSSLVAQYEDAPRVWTEIAQRKTFEDFKPQYFREFDWDKGLQVQSNAGVDVAPGSLARIPELTEYPTFNFTTSKNQIQIHKNGARLPFSWESVINDEWGFISSIPANMARLALNTEETEVFGVLAGKAGPNADVFKGALAPANLPLTLDNLKAAKKTIRNRKVNGRYVNVPKFALVVSTALEDQAREILGVTGYKESITNGNVTREMQVSTANSDVKLVVANVLGDIDQSATSATTWYLVPANGQGGAGRTSLFAGFLRNHERPEFRQSGNTGTYLGGGAVPGLEGSLLNDDIEYRVRHVVTGGYHYTDALFASKGA